VSPPADRITIECPSCGGTWEEWPIPGFESDLDPQLADPGWVQAHGTATCPHCGRTACCAAQPGERELWRSY
jgi:hypothetical protein